MPTFDLFSIGIGPSSSHTVGPMRAAKIFVEDLNSLGVLRKVSQIRVDLYGSLALTGVGHGTPNAILMGLEGETPELVDAKAIKTRIDLIYKSNKLSINGTHPIDFNADKHLIFRFTETLPAHPNGMRFSCFDDQGELIATNEFFSIGGGFVVNDNTELAHNVYYKDKRIDHTEEVTEGKGLGADIIFPQEIEVDSTPAKVTRKQSHSIHAALPFHNCESLVQICKQKNMTIAQVVYENELHWRSAEEVTSRTLHLWQIMDESIRNGISSNEEFLPGGLKVKRRAPALHRKLMGGLAEYAGFSSAPINGRPATALTKKEIASSKALAAGHTLIRPNRSLPALDWISLYALAVNEGTIVLIIENAAGGRVVTAPTNGAAGTIPAVLKYYLEFICPSPAQRDHDVVEFLLTASAIGMLYKRGASISAAEMGCQGEVGVACSMAAGAFTAVMGGTIEQIEQAAEIAMEHNLGLTCDPPMGLVVIPCIERNALAAVKAITASQLALNGDGKFRVTLDQVIATMRQTGMDMMSKYKETSEGGLAVNVPVC
ncbi:hypothetical protein HDV06_000958 [Boothiomyces sp. JEL0866]|nr:hypothetical protein HDV06_000958 [Boothiomyces sp. JEL0866]